MLKLTGHQIKIYSCNPATLAFHVCGRTNLRKHIYLEQVQAFELNVRWYPTSRSDKSTFSNLEQRVLAVWKVWPSLASQSSLIKSSWPCHGSSKKGLHLTEPWTDSRSQTCIQAYIHARRIAVSGEKESGPDIEINTRVFYRIFSVTCVIIVPIMDLISAWSRAKTY